MKRIIFVISAFCFFLLSAFALSAQPGWIQHYEPFQMPIMDYSYDSGNIKVLDDGCFVVNGTCAESDDIIGWYSEFGFLIKFDPDGSIIWAQRDSLSSSPDLWECQSIGFDLLPDGGFVSVGNNGWSGNYLYFRDSQGNYVQRIFYEDMNYHAMKVIDDEPSILIGGYSPDLGGAFLQKTDIEGNEIWSRDYSDFCTYVRSITAASDGGYALGCFRNNNYQLVKTDTAGTVEWYRSYDYNGQSDIINSMICTSDGGYLLCGYTYTPDPGGFIVKTDAVGDTLWTKKYELHTTESAFENTDGFIIFGFNENGSYLRQIDFQANTLWYNQVQISNHYSSDAEHCFSQTTDGYIIFLRGNWAEDDIELIKTDENGIVHVNDNTIVQKPELNLSCYPNPFNPSLTISYSVNEFVPISLEIYNIKGEMVDNIKVNNKLSSVIWNAGNHSSGIYFVTLRQNGEIRQTKKITLIK